MSETEKRKLIENYVRAYNNFDIEEMLRDLHERIIFKNNSNGETTLELSGIKAFRDQARQVADLFAEREQKITHFIYSEEVCEIEIDYRATLVADLPNGLKTGDKIELKGKSVFRFADGKIIAIEDIS